MGSEVFGRHGSRRTVGDVWGTLTEAQRNLFYRYTYEVCNGYLNDGTRKAYAKMALGELSMDQLKVLAFLEAKLLEVKKGDKE